MILCLSASPALDVTYWVDRLTAGTTHRVRETAQRPGGKAINVARLLHSLDENVRLLTTAGGDTGAELVAGLTRYGIPHDVLPTASATRRTVAVVDQTTAAVTMFNEPAWIDDWPHFVGVAAELIPRADVVVISGVLPGGAPVDGFAQLIRTAREHERPVVLDTSGPALVAALEARPTIVKPNADELLDCSDETDPILAARDIAERWGVTVVASLGSDGLVAFQDGAAWRATPARVLAGNPTGAGDAVVAGLARGLRAGIPVGSLLTDCVALASAAVQSDTAGDFDPLDYERELANQGEAVLETGQAMGQVGR
jgi:tagatose 6-phosphate kinase